ncbi:DUF4430 domain-containing protein [Butyrivibrio sp. INlla16]|uniref:DUF4430 domain-containing protein n=1 Tax=Butyrivibrio sp. INlla16 TaxID=1520807 RepID=UPI000889DB07|nr:DUF4430 domain-containing protein [Butyrivibrio sp. INlla16]SDB65777.1 protein of unknown function [Butyrivibrio sp. INlla16]
MNKTNKKPLIIGAIILVALIAVFGVVYTLNKPATHTGSKDIVVEVTGSDGKTTDYKLSTDAEYLIQAMDELSSNGSGFSYSGSDSEYGIMIEYINGEKAIYAEDAAYWSLYVNGEYGQYGADSQPVESGDTYTWAYEKAQ